MPKTDTEKAISSKGKDNSSFVESLYSNYHEKLINYIASHSVDRDEALDISQETYFRMSRLADISNIKHPQAFLFRTALNILRDRFRRKTPENHRAKTGYEFDQPEIESNITPLRELEAKRKLKKVQSALESLSPNARNVFLLHRFENMTYSQIAEHCGISVSGVSKHMIKAIAHITAAMEAK